MPKREVIDTGRAPHTGLPYAQALRYGDLVFVAGQVALDPKTNQPSGGDVAAQTRRVLDNISAILIRYDDLTNGRVRTLSHSTVETTTQGK